MAKLTINKNLEKYEKSLFELGAHAEGIIKASVYDAAGMVVESIKSRCPHDSGDLQASCCLTPFKNEKGYVHTKVTFGGYDSKGTPNILKARVLESGRSDQTGKNPFVRKGVDAVKAAATARIEKELEKRINDFMK